jgi:putative copper export protein
VALFFFGGGLLCAVLLASPAGPAGWLVAGEGPKAITPDGGTSDEAARRIWRRTRAAGWMAAVAGVGVVVAETRDAAGSLSPSAVDAYLLSTASGASRATAVLAVVVAAALAGRAWRAAAGALVVALAAIAFGGHANSASPRSLALLTDWIHLVAGAVWAGGIAQIVVTWLPRISRLPAGRRMTVVGAVLERFGGIALPAFAVVVIAGIGNALIELGRPAELWATSYGRVLLVKIVLVAAVGVASYLHAFRLRPQVLKGEGSPLMEQRLWRLVSGEPAVLVVVLVIAAALAVFPLPPRQLLERAEAERSARPTAASAGPPRAGELAVAEEAGPWIAAAWVRSSGPSLRGTVRLLDFNVRPVPASIRVAGARVRPCGAGCASVQTAGAPRLLRVTAQRGRSTHTALIPVRWNPRRAAAAQAILRRGVAFVRRVRSFRIAERLASGLGGRAALSRYRVQGPFRYAIVTHSNDTTETVVIGRRSWVRQPDGSWMKEPLDRPQDARINLPWFPHRAQPPRLLGLRIIDGRRVAEIALADLPARAGTAPPFWFRLQIDADSGRVLRMRMIAPGHFMNQRYYALNVPNRVEPPPTELVR